MAAELPPPLAGRIALITGASRGIGAALAEALAALGAHIILVARTQGGLEAVEAAIHARGGTATLVPMDITQGAQVDSLANHIATRWGRLDLLVLNAGLLGDISPVPHLEPKLFEAVISTNLTASYHLLRACDPLLKASPAGRVVAISSSLAQSPRAYWGAYAASKAGMEALIRCYGDEVEAISHVRVAIVDPGRTATRMRAAAFPGEDPAPLPSAAQRAATIARFIADDFPTGTFYRCAESL